MPIKRVGARYAILMTLLVFAGKICHLANIELCLIRHSGRSEDWPEDADKLATPLASKKLSPHRFRMKVQLYALVGNDFAPESPSFTYASLVATLYPNPS